MSLIALAHVRELAARKSKAYELLLALEENPQADESCFQSLAQIVDRVLFNEISLDGGDVGRSPRDCEVRNPGGGVDAGGSGAGSFGSRARSRKHPRAAGGLSEVAARAVSGTARPHFLGILPNIAVHLKDMQESGVDSLIACLNACTSAEDCELLAGCVDRYRETSGSVLIAAAEIAGIAIRANSRPLVEKLMAAVPPEAMLDSKPARELLPAMARLKAPAALNRYGPRRSAYASPWLGIIIRVR